MIVPIRPERPLDWPAIVEELPGIVNLKSLFIVGGTVRDVYMGRTVQDLDLATAADGRTVARAIANAYAGVYYELDDERGVGRALIPYEGETLKIDVARFRGRSLEADLRDRDFTINAIAADIHDLEHLLDPLDGVGDIHRKVLNLCHPDAIANDPVRALRAVRQSLAYHMKMAPATVKAVKEYGVRILDCSPERIRDEVFKLLNTSRASSGLTTLDALGILSLIFPEIVPLKGMEQPTPHVYDVWRHTVSVMSFIEQIYTTLSPHRDDNTTANLGMGLIAYSFPHMRPQLQAHIAQEWPNERTHRALLVLAALAHDIGKPDKRTVTEDGTIHFIQHEMRSTDLVTEWGERLRLSNDEIKRLTRITQNHMRPLHLFNAGKLSRRALYRFWRDTGEAGVDICLLSLADYLGTYGGTLKQDNWLAYVDLIRQMLEGYFVQADELVTFPVLVDGNLLMANFDLPRGPIIGTVLEAVREAQAVGDVNNEAEALAWVAQWLEDHPLEES